MMEFTCNYTKADFEAVMEDANKELYYALEFGTMAPRAYLNGKVNIPLG